MRLLSSLSILVWVAGAGAGLAAAEQQVVEFDPAATSIRFELGATMHTVHGTVSLDRGRIAFDPATGEASGEIVVQASSADTDNAKRDKKMHAKVLESERFPTIVLKPVRINGALPASGTQTVTVEADLEIHGATHRISFPAQITAAGGGMIDLVAELDVPYVEWGLEDPSTFVLRVSKVISVTVESRVLLSALLPQHQPQP